MKKYNHLMDNNGDLAVSKMIILTITFVILAIVIAAIVGAIRKSFPTGAESTINDYLS